MTSILKVFAFCLAALGLGLILDGYGALTPHSRTFTAAVPAPAGPGLGLRVEVVDTLAPAWPSALNPCLPAPRFDLALARPSLARG